MPPPVGHLGLGLADVALLEEELAVEVAGVDGVDATPGLRCQGWLAWDRQWGRAPGQKHAGKRTAENFGRVRNSQNVNWGEW